MGDDVLDYYDTGEDSWDTGYTPDDEAAMFAWHHQSELEEQQFEQNKQGGSHDASSYDDIPF